MFSYPFIKPEIIQIDLTHRCNLDCKMCNVKQYPVKETDELTKDEIIYLLNQAKEMGVRKLVLAGGEPLLRKDIFDICAYAKQIDIHPIIVSNGTLINNCFEEIIDKFNGTISISLDGTEESHDYLRGEGTFRKTVEGVRNIVNLQKKRGLKNISLCLGLVITKSNYKDLVQIVRIAKELEVDEIYFIPLTRDNTNLNDTSHDHFLWFASEEIGELSVLLKEADKLARKEKVNLVSKIAGNLIVQYYEGVISYKQWMCYGGFKNIFVTLCNPEEKEYCQLYVRICMEFIGNIRKCKLKDIWFSKAAFQARKKIKYCKFPCMQPCFPGAVPNRFQRLLNNIFRFAGN